MVWRYLFFFKQSTGNGPPLHFVCVKQGWTYVNTRLRHTSCKAKSFMCQLYFTQLFSSYNYERITVSVDNSSTSVSACSPAESEGPSATDATETLSTVINAGKIKLWCWIPFFCLSSFILESSKTPARNHDTYKPIIIVKPHILWFFYCCCKAFSELCSQKYGYLWPAGCEKTTNSYLWLFVLVGNLLRGIGEAPIMPLGVSYIDDFSKEENSAFYIGNVQMSDFYARHSVLQHFYSQANTQQKSLSG